METLVGLLFILLPVIFKLIEKKLQDSGNTAQAGKVREIAELFENKEDDSFDEVEPETVFEPVASVPVFTMPESEGARVEREALEKLTASVQKPPKTTPTLKDEPKRNKNKKEKIDPKKLVIYSEIMKPKYQD